MNDDAKKKNKIVRYVALTIFLFQLSIAYNPNAIEACEEITILDLLEGSALFRPFF